MHRVSIRSIGRICVRMGMRGEADEMGDVAQG
jgi:hypothetical protein